MHSAFFSIFSLFWNGKPPCLILMVAQLNPGLYILLSFGWIPPEQKLQGLAIKRRNGLIHLSYLPLVQCKKNLNYSGHPSLNRIPAIQFCSRHQNYIGFLEITGWAVRCFLLRTGHRVSMINPREKEPKYGCWDDSDGWGKAGKLHWIATLEPQDFNSSWRIPPQHVLVQCNSARSECRID